jgi:hypothetical protein
LTSDFFSNSYETTVKWGATTRGTRGK